MAAKKNKTVVQPAWRPDFRQVDALPDVKLIRTDFVFNGFAIVILIAILIFGASTEATILTVAGERDGLQAQIDENDGQNRTVQGLNGRYQRAANKLKQVDRFRATSFAYSSLVTEVVSLVPEGVVVQSLDIQEATGEDEKERFYVITVQGTVIEPGEGIPGSRVITDFRDALVEAELWAEALASNALESNRDIETRFWTFTINLRIAA